MKTAFVLFDGMTSMDFIGFYEAITWLKILNVNEEMTWSFCAIKQEVKDDRGLLFRANRVLPDLGEFDLVFVPGGYVTRELRHEEAFIAWIRTAEPARYKISVCTGALLLGAAGFLQGKKATTNASAYVLLEPYCAEVVKARVVRDGSIVTGGGVTASIDTGLFTVEMLSDADTVRKVQEKLEYPHYRAGNHTAFPSIFS